MAITAETRQDIMELVVAANNAAPGTTLLSELVALSTAGSSLLDIANTLANSASFKATYPTFQTATEFGTEFLNNLVPEASAAAKAEGVAIIEGMLNAGQSRGAVILEAATYLAAQSESHASFGTSAALFNNRVEVATYHTITSEAAAPWAIPSSVTSSDATVTTGKTAVDTALTPAAETSYTLSVTGGTVDEGDSGQSNLTYTLSLDKAAVADVVVNYSTADGTGEAGSDYDAAAGSVTFVAGQQNATVNVKINGDTTFESDETVNVTFSGSNLTASVTASATISNDDTDPSTVAQAKTLTTGTDAFSTGSGNDTFDASTAGSLDTVDSIDGGAGSDTLTATLGAESIRPTISNVETIKLTATGALTIDARDISGVSKYANESSSNDLTLNNLGEIPTLDLNTIVDDVTVNFADATLAGASDSMTINLNSVTLAGGERLTVSDAGGTNKLETIVLTSNSLASSLAGLTTSAVGTTALTITGDADLTVSAVDAAVATVDASAFTGALTATLNNTTGLTSVKGGTGVDIITAGTTAADSFELGAGNDVLNMATANLTSADTIAGGAGTDTLAMSNASTVVDADFTNVTGVETLSYGNNTLTLTLGSASNASGLATVTDGTANASITVGAGHTNALAVGLSTGDDTVDGSASAAALTVTMAGASLDGNDAITGGTSTSDNFKVSGTASNAGMTVVTGFETITANDTTTGVSITTDQLTVADGKSLTIDGTGLTTGVLTASVADDTDGINTVQGGGAADIITASASDQGDTLHGNAGNDTFTFATAQFTSIDTVDGGAGTDIITFSDADTVVDADFTNVSNVETLTGHTGNSSITLGPLATAAGIVNVNPGTGTNTVTIPATHTGDLTVTVSGTDTVSPAATYAGKLTVKSTVDAQTTDTLTGGAGTSDTLILTADGTDLVANDLDTVTLFEVVDIAFNGDIGITSASEMIATGKSMTYTASGQTTGAVTLDVTETTDTTSSQSITFGGTGAHIVTLGSGTDTYTYNYSGTGTHGVQTVVGTAGNNTITTLDAADIITLGTGNDTVNSGAGNDTINVATANFTSADTVDGGAGTDSVALSNNATVVDADFTNLSNVETISYGNNTMTLTLGSESDDAGIATVTDGTGAASITLAAGRTNALTVALSTGNDTVNASASSAALTVTAAEASIDGNDTITGGAGSSDTLTITGGGAGLTAAEMANVSAFETFKTATDAALSLTTAAGNVAASGALTVDASSLTTAALTFDGTAEGATTPGAFTINTAGTGAHIVTLGSGNDTYTYGYAGTGTDGVQTVVATAGNNTITTLDAADIITLGTGNDTVNSGTGNDTINVATANFTSADTVDGGAGTDSIALSDAATVVDADFTNLSNVETISYGNNTMTLTLAGESDDAGIATVTDGTANASVTVAAGRTNALTVALSSGNDTVNASASAAAVTVTSTDANFDSNDTFTGGTGTGDTLTITASGTALTAANLANVTGVETFKVANNVAQSITTNDANVAATKSMTVNTAAMTTAALTFVGSAETDGSFSITTAGTGAHIITLGNGNDTYTSTNTAGVNTVTATAGNNTITTAAGADIITLGTGTDTVTSGAANDVIQSATANLNNNDTIDAGAGTDSLSLSDDAVVIDSDFTNISNLETVTASANINMTLTLGALAQAAGVATVTLTDTGAADTVTVGAGFTNALAVNNRSDATAGITVSAASYTGTLTVNSDATDLDSNASTITGGTGTADELKVTGSAALTVIDLQSVTNVEKVTAVGTAGGFSLTTVDALIASGKSLTIDTTAGDDDAFTVDASAETNGTVTINGDGSGAYIITLGAGADTYNNTAGTGVHTVTGTNGNNTIKTGTGADIIVLGAGTDTITGGAGANVVDLNIAGAVKANTAVITDWTAATYLIDIDFTNIDTGRNIVDLSDASDAAATDGGVEVITGAFDLGTADATDNILVVNLTAGIADSDALETAFEYGGSLQLTADGALSVGDSWFAVYDDTVSTYIALVTTNNDVPDNGWFGSGTLTATNLIKLTGVADATDVVVGEIDFT